MPSLKTVSDFELWILYYLYQDELSRVTNGRKYSDSDVVAISRKLDDVVIEMQHRGIKSDQQERRQAG